MISISMQTRRPNLTFVIKGLGKLVINENRESLNTHSHGQMTKIILNGKPINGITITTTQKLTDLLCVENKMQYVTASEMALPKVNTGNLSSEKTVTQKNMALAAKSNAVKNGVLAFFKKIGGLLDNTKNDGNMAQFSLNQPGIDMCREMTWR